MSPNRDLLARSFPDILQFEGEDVDETVLNYAEVKALAVGNPLIKRRVELMNDLDKYRILHRDYVEERMKKKRKLAELPEQIENYKKRVVNSEQDIAFVATNGNNYKTMPIEEQRAIREAIYAAVKTHVNKPVERKVLTYQGFDVVVPERMQPVAPKAKDENEALLKERIPYVYVKRCGTYRMEIESMQGITKRLNNLLENLDVRKGYMMKEIERLEFLKATLENELAVEGSSYYNEIHELTIEIAKIDEELGLKSA